MSSLSSLDLDAQPTIAAVSDPTVTVHIGGQLVDGRVVNAIHSISAPMPLVEGEYATIGTDASCTIQVKAPVSVLSRRAVVIGRVGVEYFVSVVNRRGGGVVHQPSGAVELLTSGVQEVADADDPLVEGDVEPMRFFVTPSTIIELNTSRVSDSYVHVTFSGAVTQALVDLHRSGLVSPKETFVYRRRAMSGTFVELLTALSPYRAVPIPGSATFRVTSLGHMVELLRAEGRRIWEEDGRRIRDTFSVSNLEGTMWRTLEPKIAAAEIDDDVPEERRLAHFLADAVAAEQPKVNGVDKWLAQNPEIVQLFDRDQAQRMVSVLERLLLEAREVRS